MAEHRITFDARGPSHALCTCPASGICQHIVAAAITLQRLGAQASDASGAPKEVSDVLAPLRDALLAIPAKALMAHAGRAAYRWAWQFVADQGPENPLQIGGDTHLLLSFQRPRLSLRYMGGGLENLLADTDIAQLEKYRVAAVLAFQLAHGQTLVPPEPSPRERKAELDLGSDHKLADSAVTTQKASRERLRERATQLLAECLELGLAHLREASSSAFQLWLFGPKAPNTIAGVDASPHRRPCGTTA
ncbi:MAG: hypothetical protein QM686_09000 [Herbaspirillum sp.]